MLEGFAGAASDSMERVVGNVELDIDLVREALRQSSQQCAASGEPYAVLDDVGIKLRRSVLQHMEYGCLNLRYGLVETVGDLLMGDSRFDRMGCHEVRSADYERFRLVFEVGKDRPDGDLYLLGGYFSDLDVVLLTEVVLYVAREDIACGPDAVLYNKTSERDDCNLGCTSAYVNHHVALRSFDVEADSEGGGHRLEYEEDIASAGVLGGVADGSYLDFRGS